MPDRVPQLAPDQEEDSLRVLMVAPGRRDQSVTLRAFAEQRVELEYCESVTKLCERAREGTGVIIIPAAFTYSGLLSPLYAFLKEQPPWSDIPIVFIIERDRHDIGPLYEAGNVTVLSHPIRLVTLLSVVRSGLASRRKQYQLRDLLKLESKTRQELQLIDQRKDEFLATLAHELRNPLGPLQNSLELLEQQRPPEEEQQELHHLMSRQVKQMRRLVEDLLDVSRITRGRLRLIRREMDLRDAVVAAVEATQSTFKANGVALQVRQGDDPLFVYGDEQRLAQLVTNLLTNAARYTPHGGRVELNAGTLLETRYIEVTDSGVGIPADKLDLIFTLFQQHDVESERGQAGLGIGLTLVRRLAQLHGGDVIATSDGVNCGATFLVRLPCSKGDRRRVDPPANPDAHRPIKRPARVLLVEDTRANRYVLERLLNLLVDEVLTAQDGVEALTIARERPLDLIISDIAMPRMNGYSLAKAIRAAPELAETPLVALTGYSREEDRDRALKAGFDHHLAKPVDFELLSRLVNKLLDGRDRAG